MNKKMQLMLTMIVLPFIITGAEKEPITVASEADQEWINITSDLSYKIQMELEHQGGGKYVNIRYNNDGSESILKKDLVDFMESHGLSSVSSDTFDAIRKMDWRIKREPISNKNYYSGYIVSTDALNKYQERERINRLPFIQRWAYKLGLGSWFSQKPSSSNSSVSIQAKQVPSALTPQEDTPIATFPKDMSMRAQVMSNVLFPDYYNTHAARSDFYTTHEGEIFSDTEITGIPLRSTKRRYEIIPGSPVDKLRKIDVQKAITPTPKTMERAKKLETPYIPAASSKDSVSKALKRAERFGGYQ